MKIIGAGLPILQAFLLKLGRYYEIRLLVLLKIGVTRLNKVLNSIPLILNSIHIITNGLGGRQVLAGEKSKCHEKIRQRSALAAFFQKIPLPISKQNQYYIGFSI